MRRPALLAVALLLATAGIAIAADPIGVITELQLGGGHVEVKPAAGGDWQPARPLLAVHAGDQLRASGDARAVVVFMASQRGTILTEASSPLTAAAPAEPGIGERLKAALGFLQTASREPSRVAASMRGSRELAPLIVAPRGATLVTPEALTLDFTGPERLRYTARILAADGRVLWEGRDLAPRPVTLSAREVRLAPGRYHWELQAPGHGVQHASFDVPAAEVTGRVKAALAQVAAARYPPATAALLRAAGLMRERFYADARRELLAGLAVSPAEPTLHLLLANVYQETGPEGFAEREFADAAAPPAR
ncbi:MAG TPA: hypothetical protein VFL90_10945 [Methylomirabilota bacterium]|nr:hypothetical protein [Methylomirabilota bacterium]